MKHMLANLGLARIDWGLVARVGLVLLVAGLACDPVAAQTSVMPSGAEAVPAFERLWLALKDFSLIGLAIGLIIGGLAWVFGKPTIAMGVFIAAFVMFGGPYIVGLIHDSLVGGY